jgi:hypothetical protein
MKVLLLVGLTFASIFSFESFISGAQENNQHATIEQPASTLQLSLVSPKRRYRRGDQFELQVLLRNSGEKPIYVFGTLDWGYSGSLMFYMTDASGREIKPQLSPDSQTYASPDDTSEFVKLGADHFLGTNYYAPLRLMNLTRPGKYAIFVEYNSPFSAKDVKITPFWGKEKGTLKSNLVWIEVVR